jgi:transglutaminase-like putative cysteine protease
MADEGAERHLSCFLSFDVAHHATLALQVAVDDRAVPVVAERLEVEGRDGPVGDVTEIRGDLGGRTHLVRVGPGPLHIRYEATAGGGVTALPPHEDGGGADGGLEPIDDEAVVALRQSRYCPSDALLGFAAAELGRLPAGPGLASAIASWVFERLVYELESSGPLDTAVDTLVANVGVCRDFAHLTIALCRARGIPARLAAVYAPGLDPMDFHAVVEVRVGGTWEVLDATRLAPRSSLVRIATGRDAADTAFATTLAGEVTLTSFEIGAVVDGRLPYDDHVARVRLP